MKQSKKYLWLACDRDNTLVLFPDKPFRNSNDKESRIYSMRHFGGKQRRCLARRNDGL